MNEKYILFLLLPYCNIDMVCPMDPDKFQKTKAEDFDAILPPEKSNSFPSCDLTSQLCDINCCSDQDCSKEEKESFLCSVEENNEFDNLKHMYCEHIGLLDSVGNPLMCLQNQNSPYLGDFYIEEENISDHSFSEILTSRNKNIYSFINADFPESKPDYRYGSAVFLPDSSGKNHHIDISSNILSKQTGYCTKIPLKFLINEVSCCFLLMSEDKCLFNTELHLQHHINELDRLKLLGDVNNVDVTYTIICLNDSTNYISLSSYYKVKEKIVAIYDITECQKDIITEINQSQNMCENVVVGMNYTISVDGTVIKSININIIVGNIPINMSGFHSLGKSTFKPSRAFNTEVIYALQKISVTFKDADVNRTISKQGYGVGQPLYSNS